MRTKYDGVFLDALAEARGAVGKFAFKVKWRGPQVMRSGFATAATARDARLKMQAELIENNGRLPHHHHGGQWNRDVQRAFCFADQR